MNDVQITEEGTTKTILVKNKAGRRGCVVNTIMLLGTFIVVDIIGFYMFFIDRPDYLPFYIGFIPVSIVTVGIIVSAWIMRKIYESSMAVFEAVINKNDKTVNFPREKLTFKFNQIRDIRLTNVQVLTQQLNAITLVLVDGERTLNFKFKDYNTGSEVLKIIKELI